MVRRREFVRIYNVYSTICGNFIIPYDVTVAWMRLHFVEMCFSMVLTHFTNHNFRWVIRKIGKSDDFSMKYATSGLCPKRDFPVGGFEWTFLCGLMVPKETLSTWNRFVNIFVQTKCFVDSPTPQFSSYVYFSAHGELPVKDYGLVSLQLSAHQWSRVTPSAINWKTGRSLIPV